MSKSQDSGKTETEMHRTTGPSVGRRNFLRAAAAGAGAATVGAASTGTRYSPVGNAQAVAPVVLAGAGIAVTAGVSYLAGRMSADADHVSVDEIDDSQQADLRLEIFDRATTLREQQDAFATAMNNRIEDGQHIAFSRAKRAALESMNNGKSEAEAKRAGQLANDEYYSHIQMNVFDYWNALALEIGHLGELTTQVGDYDDPEEVAHERAGESYADEDPFSPIQEGAVTSPETRQHELLDGTSYEIRSFSIAGDPLKTAVEVVDRDHPVQMIRFYRDGYMVTGSDFEEFVTFRIGSYENYVNSEKYSWGFFANALEEQHSRIGANVDEYVTGLYENYEPGEIDITDFMDASDVAQGYASDYESSGYYAHAGAALGQLGHAGDLNANMLVTFPNVTDPDTGSPAQVEGTVMGNATIDPQEVTASTGEWIDVNAASEFGWVVTSSDGSTTYARNDDYDSRVTDDGQYQIQVFESGSITEGETLSVDTQKRISLETGIRYDPADYSEPFLLATNDEIYQLEEVFVIEEATNAKTGESMDSVQFRDYNYQRTDPQQTEEMLAQNRQLREEARDVQSGSGSGSGFDLENEIWGIPVIGWAIGGIAGIAAVLQGMNN